MLRLSAPCGALPDSAPLVGVSGGGFNLAWMLGVAHEMRASGVPMRRCVFSGASAGAGVAALMCCDADFRGSLEWALALPEVQHAFERPWGALGMAATMGRRVMDRFLPADAAQRCEGRLFVLLHDVQKGHRFQSSFRDREDLIDAVLTSAHVPLLSDGRLMRRHAGGYYVDGAWFSTRDAVLLCRPGAAMRVLVDHSEVTSFMCFLKRVFLNKQKPTHRMRSCTRTACHGGRLRGPRSGASGLTSAAPTGKGSSSEATCLEPLRIAYRLFRFYKSGVL